MSDNASRDYTPELRTNGSRERGGALRGLAYVLAVYATIAVVVGLGALFAVRVGWIG